MVHPLPTVEDRPEPLLPDAEGVGEGLGEGHRHIGAGGDRTNGEPHLEADALRTDEHPRYRSGAGHGVDCDVVRPDQTAVEWLTSPRKLITKWLAGAS